MNHFVDAPDHRTIRRDDAHVVIVVVPLQVAGAAPVGADEKKLAIISHRGAPLQFRYTVSNCKVVKLARGR